MATTIHLPNDLLSAVDRRAAARGISRNLYIRRALERVVAEEQEWSPAFLAELEKVRVDLPAQALLDTLGEPIDGRGTTTIVSTEKIRNTSSN